MGGITYPALLSVEPFLTVDCKIHRNVVARNVVARNVGSIGIFIHDKCRTSSRQLGSSMLCQSRGQVLPRLLASVAQGGGIRLGNCWWLQKAAFSSVWMILQQTVWYWKSCGGHVCYLCKGLQSIVLCHRFGWTATPTWVVWARFSGCGNAFL